MDVIALRKRTGTITGTILMNGWPQEAVSFRRCSGYVYQFDVQSPELTVRETILFSAKLRLDPDLVTTDEEIYAFVDQVMVRSKTRNMLVSSAGNPTVIWSLAARNMWN
jgi:ABC-type multidrug transport system ATPase subunit